MAGISSEVLSAAVLGELVRPAGVLDVQWQTVGQHVTRLHDAVAKDDRALAIGCAKELAEAVAKLVMVVRGETPTGGESFPALIGRAHMLLERQPGEHLSSSDPMLKVVQGAKTIVSQLAQIRNTYGTGHGRAQDPEILQELMHVTLGGAGLWVKWALRRLDVMSQGMPGPLIESLTNGGIFYRGTLAARLVAADLPNLDPAAQRRLGVAVGQRAAGNTMVVQDDGIEECARSGDVTAWPAAYRQGAFEGLFLGQFEQVTLSDWSVKWAARLLSPLQDEAAAIITDLNNKITGLPLHIDPAARSVLADALAATSSLLPEGARPPWSSLVETLRTAP